MLEFLSKIALGPFLKAIFSWVWKKLTTKTNYFGGKGGNAKASGNAFAKGGPGGKGGPWGPGGNGGSALADGNGIALGGEGGEAAQLDKGGRGGRSGAEVHGIPNRLLPDGTWLWDYGRGGDGASPPPQP